jgi:hypothetical protein
MSKNLKFQKVAWKMSKNLKFQKVAFRTRKIASQKFRTKFTQGSLGTRTFDKKRSTDDKHTRNFEKW